MYNWNQFRNFPKIKELNQNEQIRQYLIYQSNMMMEQSLTQVSNAANGPGGGSAGGRRPQAETVYLVQSFNSGLLYFAGMEELSMAGAQPFGGIAAMCECTDDPGHIYFVAVESGASVFGKINKQTFERTDIDTTNLNALTQKAPSAIYYEGNGVFVYMAPLVQNDGSGTTDIFRITTGGEAQLVSSLSNDGAWPMGIAAHDGQVWVSTLESGIISSMQTIDVETGVMTPVDYFYMNVDSLPEGVANTKVWYVFGLASHLGKLYANVVFTDKDNGILPYQCIGEVNLENLEITALVPVSVGFGDVFTQMAIYQK